MRRPGALPLAALLTALAACSSESPGVGSPTPSPSPVEVDASESRDAAGVDGEPVGIPDAGPPQTDAAEGGAAADAADGGNGCAVSGAPGECMTTSACAALAGHTSFPGYCPGPASVECCIVTPNTADNPPVPAGYMLMAQSQVTPDMTTWAVAILDDPATYPMFSTTLKTFGTLMVLARVEWHPPDFQNSAVHRGVTLYVPV